MSQAALNLIEKLQGQGFPARIISLDRAAEVCAEIADRYESGFIGDKLHREYLSGFDDNFSGRLEGAQSIIVATAFQPITEVDFEQDGRRYTALIPPTYNEHTDDHIEEAINDLLSPFGYSCLLARLPEKLLAARSGLVRYGRNNITYVPDLGSFHRLSAYYSDLPVENEIWGEPEILDRCGKCSACIQACPPQALDPERFQVRAEICLTFFNETNDPMPEWIDPAWHHCAIGCLNCQRVCPVNASFLKQVQEGGVFNQEETRLIMSDRPWDELPVEVAERLERVGLKSSYDVLPRNLSLLFNQY